MKNNSVNPVEDLQAIREIMEKSSKFLSLSGLAGIFAGLCALAGVAVAQWVILGKHALGYAGFIIDREAVSGAGLFLSIDLLLVFGVALTAAVLFSWRRAKQAGQPLWTLSTRRLLFHLLVPFLTGALVVAVLVIRHYTELVLPSMLIFYGLALVNAGKFTLGEVHWLGMAEIILGLAGALFPDFGLICWTAGFGIAHLVYGTWMYYRHER